MNITIEEVSKIAIDAGAEILNIYEDPARFGDIDYKADNSPLTIADKASNRIIVDSLKGLDDSIPILSEEEKGVPYSIRKDWGTFWLVDPLDGTKEFIKRNGEFTVNIALIANGFPSLGIIYAPVLDKLYVGLNLEKKAYLRSGDGDEVPLTINSRNADRVAVGSRSHSSEEEAALLKQYDVVESISIGSSLKFCMVAEGKADIYYRHGPTMEWDTGAGQAIVEAAGGTVINMKTKSRFGYNKENLLNGSFLVKGF